MKCISVLRCVWVVLMIDAVKASPLTDDTSSGSGSDGFNSTTELDIDAIESSGDESGSGTDDLSGSEDTTNAIRTTGAISTFQAASGTWDHPASTSATRYAFQDVLTVTFPGDFSSLTPSDKDIIKSTVRKEIINSASGHIQETDIESIEIREGSIITIVYFVPTSNIQKALELVQVKLTADPIVVVLPTKTLSSSRAEWNMVAAGDTTTAIAATSFLVDTRVTTVWVIVLPVALVLLGVTALLLLTRKGSSTNSYAIDQYDSICDEKAMRHSSLTSQSEYGNTVEAPPAGKAQTKPIAQNLELNSKQESYI